MEELHYANRLSCSDFFTTLKNHLLVREKFDQLLRSSLPHRIGVQVPVNLVKNADPHPSRNRPSELCGTTPGDKNGNNPSISSFDSLAC